MLKHCFAFYERVMWNVTAFQRFDIFVFGCFLFIFLQKKYLICYIFIIIAVFWPLWIAFGQWMLYDNDSDDEFQVSIDHGYLIAPAFIIVSLSFGIIIQYVFPQCKIGILPLLKPISSYYLLFYFVLLLFCLSGSGATKIHVRLICTCF